MVILGLGSNIGARLEYLEAATHCLAESVLRITAISSIYESPALLKPGAPEEWKSEFFNMAIMGETHLSPQALLIGIKRIEKKIGRLDRGKWAPREIDIDILAYDDLEINESNLKIPHIALCERAFALLPLVEIAPNWRYCAQGPYQGKTAQAIARDNYSTEKATVKTSVRLNLERNSQVA